jgi:hypothetical protein
MEMEVGSRLLQEIQRGKLEDEKVQEKKGNIKEEKLPGFVTEPPRGGFHRQDQLERFSAK